MTKRLDGYRGRLKPGQIAEGMNAALENARRLATDADALLKASAFPSAASLARQRGQGGVTCVKLRKSILAPLICF